MSQCQATTKNQTQCLRNANCQGKYCTQHQNLVSKLPTDIISKLGGYLDFEASSNLVKSEKDVNLKKIYSSKKCVVLNFKTDTEQDILENIVTLKGVNKNIPKLQYLKLMVYKPINSNYDPYVLEKHFIEIFTEIKKFKSLMNLQFNTDMTLYDTKIDENSGYYQNFGSESVNYLFTNLDINVYDELYTIIQNFQNLRYFEYALNLNIEGDMDIEPPENKIETVSFSEMSTRNYNFDLRFFRNIKRLILEWVDYLILENLQYLKNLEVLEFGYYYAQESKDDYFGYIDILPKSIKFLSINSFELIEEDEQFYIDLVHQLPILEFLYLKDSIDVRTIDQILDLINDTSLKYLYIDDVVINDYNDEIPLIFRKIVESGILVMIKELNFGRISDYNEGKGSVNIYNKNYTIKSQEGYNTYIFQNPLTPDQWLINNGYLLKPKCQNY